jgi:hypothetical protein
VNVNLAAPTPCPQALELAPAVQDAVARLCCAWWTAGGPDKEELLSQTLPFLLVRAGQPMQPGPLRAQCCGSEGGPSRLRRALPGSLLNSAFLHRSAR